jgi:hypothetical protein
MSPFTSWNPPLVFSSTKWTFFLFSFFFPKRFFLASRNVASGATDTEIKVTAEGVGVSPTGGLLFCFWFF